MAEFSLGAAIGATGKAPRLKVPSGDTDQRIDKNLDRIRQQIALNKKVYHNAYLNDAKDLTTNYIGTLASMEKSKDPNIVERADYGLINWDTETDRMVLKSKVLFDIENFVKQPGKNYVSPSIDKAYSIIKDAKNEVSMLKKLQENPDVFADGYIGVSPETGFLEFSPKPFIDINEYIQNKLFDINAQGVEISENVEKVAGTGGKTLTQEKVYSIPFNAEEARLLKKNNPSLRLTEKDNAYEIGKQWFLSSPDVRAQFFSEKFWSTTDQANRDEIMSQGAEGLYEYFYNEKIKPNVPKKSIDKNIFLGTRTNITVNNSNNDAAPTTFQVASMILNFKNKPNALRTEKMVSVASANGGTMIRIPKNRNILSMKTGLPAFNDVAETNFYASHIGVFPTKKSKDKNGQIFLRVLEAEEVNAAAANGEKIMYLPWALASQNQFAVAAAPQVGVESYLVPLYYPEENGDVIIGPDKQSVVLDDLTRRAKWNEADLKNWNKAYSNIKGGIKDQKNAVVPTPIK